MMVFITLLTVFNWVTRMITVLMIAATIQQLSPAHYLKNGSGRTYTLNSMYLCLVLDIYLGRLLMKAGKKPGSIVAARWDDPPVLSFVHLS